MFIGTKGERYFCSAYCWRRQWHPTPGLLPGKSHGRRGLVGCGPWGQKSQTGLSDFTFTFHFPALEKAMAPHSRVLAWRIPGTGEPGGLLSVGSHRVGLDGCDLAAAAAVLTACVCFKLLQSCPTLTDLMDCSPPGSTVHRILQARILEWAAIFSSGGSS